MAGNVNLIDPHDSNINTDLVNSIPQYQDMHISVDLIGVRRGRTVLATNIDTKKTRIENTGLESDLSVSFLGENQDPNNSAHYNKFTTNWYDGSAERDKTYEGFGISNINILTNSSFIPQINIEFIDIRGLAFFNRENSPYRILFDFPPPIFYLTVKGYYGKSITYQLHLVKYNTEFKADTGNYHINGEFIAITYAPLTDILFRYIIQAPLMGKNREDTLSSEKNTPPKNTMDLILKLENLYSSIPDRIKTDVDNLKYENAQEKLDNYSNVLEVLYGFRNNEILLKNGGEPNLVLYNEIPDSENFGERTTLRNFTEYDQYLRSYGTEGIPDNIEKRLYIGYNINREDILLSAEIDIKIDTLKNKLDQFRTEILRISKDIVNEINNSDIERAETKVDNTGAQASSEAQSTRFVGIDVTNYYFKIYKARIDLEEEKNDAMNVLNQKINNMIQTRLGMLPTIYNIFNVILSDVDEFFNVLRKTSRTAEEHHEEYESQIVNDGTYKDVRTKIYPFPLVVKQKTVCNQLKEERVAPIDLSNRLDNPFPEITLVQNFIDSFIKYQRIYEQATLKQETNANGDYTWMPFTPVDSTLVNPNINSPYFGKDSPGGGTSQQPIDLTQTDKLSDILSVSLRRFYVLSQNIFASSFYDEDKETAFSYIDLYAQTEAMNLVNSITNEQYGQLLESLSKDNNTPQKIGNFYSYLNSNLNNLFTNDGEEYLTISNGDDIYRNKNNPQYNGFQFINSDDITNRTGNDNDYFSDFIEENKNTLFSRTTKEGTFTFTQENLILRRDRPDSQQITNFRNTNRFNTKFLSKIDIIRREFEKNQISFEDLSGSEYAYSDNIDYQNYDNLINDVSNQGNQYFQNKGIDYGNKITNRDKYNVSIIDIWSEFLARYDDDIFDDVIETENKTITQRRLSAILFLSNWGHTLSAFNYYPYALNRDFFTTPSVIEMPTFVKLYMGALIGIEQGNDLWNLLKEFYSNGGGVNIENGGVFIFSDIHDVNTYLSSNDRERFRLEFARWFDNEFSSFARSVKDLYETVRTESEDRCNSNNENRNFRCKRDIYTEYLDPNESPSTYSSLMTDLIKRIGIACYNDITFSYSSTIEPTTYQSLSTINNDQNRQQYNNRYWSNFFREVSIRIRERLDNLDQQRRDFRESTGDEDIMNQTYYSFKNLNDKWLSGLDNSNSNEGEERGYPFKRDPSRGLISQFAFVDRAMNPIGDTIIDPQAILNAKDNPETSIFTVLSQLLSLNGFEFFPLQNFLNFQEDEWTESFRIQTGFIEKEYPVFVCMYIGGASSYPSGLGFRGEFNDDGITDLENPGVADFLNAECAPDPDRDNQIDTLTDDANMLNKVRAFRVRYGEQNQNMFFDFAVDSNEYPETNESIQILSQLAGDNREQAPVPKAQNLYSVYENRAYKATITGWGNAMIQPTQYFQLENVPLFNGAYVILSVEHDIIANKMTTKFSGTKLLKYPIPRVLNPASILGFEGGNTGETNPDEATSADATDGEVTLGVGTAGNPQQTQYNSMYDLQIG